jgi:hypothetical protein
MAHAGVAWTMHESRRSDERRIAGLTWLVCLALRVPTLTEDCLRTTLQQRDETPSGLNPMAAACSPRAQRGR